MLKKKIRKWEIESEEERHKVRENSHTREEDVTHVGFSALQRSYSFFLPLFSSTIFSHRSLFFFKSDENRMESGARR